MAAQSLATFWSAGRRSLSTQIRIDVVAAEPLDAGATATMAASAATRSNAARRAVRLLIPCSLLRECGALARRT